MLLPDKFTPYASSVLATSTELLQNLDKPTSLQELFVYSGLNASNIDRFILAVDLLYALGSIHIDEKSGEISRAS